MGLSPIDFHYLPSNNSVVINNGHTIQINYPQGSFIVVGGKRFDLKQIHFHTPSEHQIVGEHLAMAAHLMHQSPGDEQVAVVAVLFDYGEENLPLKSIWQSISPIMGDSRFVAFDINDLLPAEKAYYSYMGSLTTPPCFENVIWNILEASLTVSELQVNLLRSLFGDNARPIQPINERVIVITE